MIAQWLPDALNSTGCHRPPLAVAVAAILVDGTLGLSVGHLLLRPMAVKPVNG